MKTLNKTTAVAMLALILMVPTFSSLQAQEVITIENGEITIVSGDDDGVIVIDADALGNLISTSMDEALDGMHEVMAELDDMQLEIRLGDDNQLSFETEDQMWEVNLDVIMSEIGSALDSAFDSMDTDGWGHHHRYQDEDFDQGDLTEELDRLKDELNQLRQELNSLKEI